MARNQPSEYPGITILWFQTGEPEITGQGHTSDYLECSSLDIYICLKCLLGLNVKSRASKQGTIVDCTSSFRSVSKMIGRLLRHIFHY